MTRLLLSVFLVIAACAPLLLLVADITHRYPADEPLTNIDLVDLALLLAALLFPLCVLSRLGVGWRSRPDEYQASERRAGAAKDGAGSATGP